MKNVIVVKDLVKKFGKTTAVDSISFTVKKGEIFALIGPNGAGKSTTLRILATVLAPTSGEVGIYDYDINQDASKIRQIMTYLPEEAGSYKNMTGMSYLKFMAAMFSDSRKEQEEYLTFAQHIAGLGDRLKTKLSSYSKGMVRKLLLARTVMSKPRLTILDEPTSGLDVTNALFIRKTIQDLTKQGMTVLLSSHNMLEIEFLSDRVGMIHKGKITGIGSSQDLMKKYKVQNLEEVFEAITHVNSEGNTDL